VRFGRRAREATILVLATWAAMGSLTGLCIAQPVDGPTTDPYGTDDEEAPADGATPQPQGSVPGTARSEDGSGDAPADAAPPDADDVYPEGPEPVQRTSGAEPEAGAITPPPSSTPAYADRLPQIQPPPGPPAGALPPEAAGGRIRERVGFFFRAGLGPSLVHIEPSHAALVEYGGHDGLSLDFAFAVGGAIAPGLVIGFEGTLDGLLSSSRVQFEQFDAQSTPAMLSVLPVLARGAAQILWYPSPDLGLNLGGSLGVGMLATMDAKVESPTLDVPHAWVGGLSVGYDLGLTRRTALGVIVHAETFAGPDDPDDGRLAGRSAGVRAAVTLF